MIFENYSRSEAALVAGMAEMVVNGVSTRKVSRVMEELCGTSFSKPTVSDVCKDLDKSVHEFRTRRWMENILFSRWMPHISRFGKTAGSSPKLS